MGGEKRKITMLMADLRGFTSLSERLPPERVVTLLNRYLTTMVSVIKQYQGTIDEFIGDAIFVLFGAPIWQEDDAQRAVACAVAMQLAMASVNEAEPAGRSARNRNGHRHSHRTSGSWEYRLSGTDKVRRSRKPSQSDLSHPVVHDRRPNLDFRGHTARSGTDPQARKQMEVKAKGIEYPITVSEVWGIGRPHQLFLPEAADELVPLGEGIPIIYTVVETNFPGEDICRGTLTKLSRKEAEARLETPVSTFSNLEIRLDGIEGEGVPGTIYGKIIGVLPGTGTEFSICFTSIPPDIDSFFRSLLAQAAAVDPQLGRNKKAERPPLFSAEEW